MDDCGIASPEMFEIDAFIDSLKDKGFELTSNMTSVHTLELIFRETETLTSSQ